MAKQPKYREYFKQMLKENQELFAQFEEWHHQYQKREMSQEEYNRRGRKVMRVVKEWETRLCSHMEGGKYNTYSARLAEKFWSEVRKKFPLLEFVGVEIKHG